MRSWKEWWSFWFFSFAFAVAVAGPTAYYWSDAPGWMSKRAPASVNSEIFYPCKCDNGKLLIASNEFDYHGEVLSSSRDQCPREMVKLPYCQPIALK